LGEGMHLLHAAVMAAGGREGGELRGARARKKLIVVSITSCTSYDTRHTSQVTRHTIFDPFVAIAKHATSQPREVHRHLHPSVTRLNFCKFTVNHNPSKCYNFTMAHTCKVNVCA